MQGSIHSPVGKDTELDAICSDPTLQPVVFVLLSLDLLFSVPKMSKNLLQAMAVLAAHSVWCAGNILLRQHLSDWGGQLPEVSEMCDMNHKYWAKCFMNVKMIVINRLCCRKL